MDRDRFLLKDRIKEIEANFLKAGWLTVYQWNPDGENQGSIFCCLVANKNAKEYLKDRNWPITPGREGKPAVWGDGKYDTYAHKGFEPFVFSRSFTFMDGHETYQDIAEEFVLYFKLYEKGTDKKNRKFYFIDEAGDLDEVIVIEPGQIKVKMKYLLEYISVRRMHFSIMFDFMRLAKIEQELDVKAQDLDHNGETYYYNHQIRGGPWIDGNRLQSWILGKLLIKPDKKKQKSYHFDHENEQYESFITGYTDKGEYLLEICKREDGKHFTLTYFKKEVLNKYYNDPKKYNVDGWHVSSNFFTLKIDNNVDNYVPVFLIELSSLPHKEQLHWKQYNIAPQNGISFTYYQTMIEGNWVKHPEAPDLYFKHKFEQFNKQWEKQFGWSFYKPLSEEDEYIFTSLHIPTSNNIKVFCEQILSLIKITIDRINEGELAKQITVEPNDRGISKLEKFLKVHEVEIPDMVRFLRSLWDLRSGLLAHSFSNSNDKCKKAIKFFNINETNYVEVARDIFIKSTYTLHTLERTFLVQRGDDEA